MKREVLLTVDYTGNEKFWSESRFKNTRVTIDESKNIHDQISDILFEADYMRLTYKNKPNGNIFVDSKNGKPKRVGYIYRGQTEIYDRSENINGAKANFDVWVTLEGVIPYEIEEI